MVVLEVDLPRHEGLQLRILDFEEGGHAVAQAADAMHGLRVAGLSPASALRRGCDEDACR
jgi:hypothetical protein